LSSSQNARQRPRLVLGFDIARDVPDALLLELITKSDLAAIILYSGQGDEARLQKRAQNLSRPIQAQNTALLLSADVRIGMRVGADGVHCEAGTDPINGGENAHSLMIGYGNIRDRHQAMLLGESGADYLMFGKLGLDNHLEPHPRNLRLASWWAELMEVPCLVQAGSDSDMLPALVATGAEFILIEEMIFGKANPCAALIHLNDCLDKTCPLRQNDA